MAKEREELNITSLYEFEKNANKVQISAIPVPVKGEARMYVGICELKSDGIPKSAMSMEAKYIPELKTFIEQAMEMDSYPEFLELGVIPKNSREQIQVSVKTYMKTEYLDIRLFYKDKEGNYKPSSKGVTIPPDCLEDLLKGLNVFEEKTALPEDVE